MHECLTTNCKILDNKIPTETMLFEKIEFYENFQRNNLKKVGMHWRAGTWAMVGGCKRQAS